MGQAQILAVGGVQAVEVVVRRDGPAAARAIGRRAWLPPPDDLVDAVAEGTPGSESRATMACSPSPTHTASASGNRSRRSRALMDAYWPPTTMNVAGSFALTRPVISRTMRTNG